MIQADGLMTSLSRLGVALGLALILGPGEVSAQSIFTIAGGGTEDGRPTTLAALKSPFSVTVDAADNVYFSDSDDCRIRRVDGATGIITTVAGNGIRGFSGDGGPATEASFKLPQGVAVDEAANRLYIADLLTSRVRRVDLGTGIIDTIAGGGNKSGEGIPATEALLLSPVGVAVDDAGNLYIADSYSDRIRRVDGASGFMTTVAGGGDRSLIGDGGPATEASLFSPQEVAVDDADNLYIADMYNSRVRRVDGATGIITTVAGPGDWAYRGDVGDGGPATETSLHGPEVVALDRAGNLYIVDLTDYRLRRVDGVTGIITTVVGNGLQGFSGDGGPATVASINWPWTWGGGVALDGEDNLYIADTDNHRVRVVFKCVEVGGPDLLTPMNGSQGLSKFPALAWERNSGAFRYDVYLDVASPPERLAAVDIETTTFSPANLQPLTTYYWKVIAKGDPFCKPFRRAESEVWSFTTASTCDAPGQFESTNVAGHRGGD